MTASRSRQPTVRMVPRVKVWLEIDGEYVFGYGISQILQAIDEVGSIKQAADRLGKSYRHIWNRVKQAEAALGQTLVVTHVGGKDERRSELTATARTLLADFLGLRQAMLAAVEEHFDGPARRVTTAKTRKPRPRGSK